MSVLGSVRPICLCGGALAPLATLLCCLIPVLSFNATLPGSMRCHHSTGWLSFVACVLLHCAPHLCECFLPLTLYFFVRIALPRCLHCLSLLLSMHYCQDAFIIYTLHFHAFPGGFHSLPVCHIPLSMVLPRGLFCLCAVFSTLGTTVCMCLFLG